MRWSSSAEITSRRILVVVLAAVASLLVAGLVAALLVVSGGRSRGGTDAGAPPAGPSLDPEGTLPLLSGLPWHSGVYVPGSSKAKVQAFANWRGHPVDVAIDSPNRASWSDIENPFWLYNLWQGTPYTKVFSVAMLPEHDRTATLQACADGAYREHWQRFAANIKARGMDDETVVRLGWEFNGDWYVWAAHDPAAYASCWRQIVTAARAVAPRLRWDWTVNRGPGQAVRDAREAYPGDDVVDIVGVDSYDIWPGVTDEASWREHVDGAFGLRFWTDFAAAHGKPFSVPEWGVFPGTLFRGHNGGDNAFYVTKMLGFFRDNSSRLAYEAYFDESAPYFAGAIFDPVQNPRASAAYLAGYRP